MSRDAGSQFNSHNSPIVMRKTKLSLNHREESQHIKTRNLDYKEVLIGKSNNRKGSSQTKRRTCHRETRRVP